MTQNQVGGFYTSAIGFGWNTEGEIEISHPASSGTAYTILAGLVQHMGEDKAFEYLKALHKNVTQYTAQRHGAGAQCG